MCGVSVLHFFPDQGKHSLKLKMSALPRPALWDPEWLCVWGMVKDGEGSGRGLGTAAEGEGPEGRVCSPREPGPHLRLSSPVTSFSLASRTLLPLLLTQVAPCLVHHVAQPGAGPELSLRVAESQPSLLVLITSDKAGDRLLAR